MIAGTLTPALSRREREGVALRCWTAGTIRQGVAAMVRAPAGLAGWHGPCVTKVPNDPWGQPYRYRFPGHKPQAFDIWTVGPDGADGTADDLASWIEK